VRRFGGQRRGSRGKGRKAMLGLKDYFQADFLNTLMIQYEFQTVVNPERQAITIYAQVHIDFTAHTKFCSFYIPGKDHNSFIELCRTALSYLKDILALRDNGFTQMLFPPHMNFWKGQTITLHRKDTMEIAFSVLEGQIFRIDEFAIAPPTYIYTELTLSASERLDVIGLAMKHNTTIRIRGPEYAIKRFKKIPPAAFVSHDSRDKNNIARPLAQGLMQMGFTVWFDEYSLKPGDRLRESIEKGMKECKKCILILTKNFLSNNGWTAAEFNMIFNREILEGKPLVVPVWFGVSKEEVFDYSPGLINVLGAHWNPDDQIKTIREISRSLE
jgi:TIR domain